MRQSNRTFGHVQYTCVLHYLILILITESLVLRTGSSSLGQLCLETRYLNIGERGEGRGEGGEERGEGEEGRGERGEGRGGRGGMRKGCGEGGNRVK